MVSRSKVKSKKNQNKTITYSGVINRYSSSFSDVTLYKDVQWSSGRMVGEACCDWAEKRGGTRSTCPGPTLPSKLRQALSALC